MTGNCRPEAEQLVASAEGAEEATSNPERGEGGCHPARRLELSVGTGGNGCNNTATNLEKAVKFAECMRDNGGKDFPDSSCRWAPHRHESNPIHRREGCSQHSGVPGRGGEVYRSLLKRTGAAGQVKRKTWVLAGAAVLVAVTVTGSVVAMSSATQATPAAQERPANTVKVEKGKLSAMVSLDGTLTYRARSDGSPYSVINQSQGTYTKLPELGQVISQGQVLYRVNDSPVVLLYGSTPAYRTLSAGATGADVAELNADLVALGYATSGQLSPTSASFGSATTTALEKLQGDAGGDRERHAELLAKPCSNPPPCG